MSLERQKVFQSLKSGNLIGTAKQPCIFLKGWALIGVQWSFRHMLKMRQCPLWNLVCGFAQSVLTAIYPAPGPTLILQMLFLFLSLLLFEVKTPFNCTERIPSSVWGKRVNTNHCEISALHSGPDRKLIALLCRFMHVRYHAIQYNTWSGRGTLL